MEKGTVTLKNEAKETLAMQRPPLHLYFLAHPNSESANKIAVDLMSRFVEPPASGGLRIPVMFTPHRGDGLPTPLDGLEKLDLDAAEHSLVVILADEVMAQTQGPNATGRAWKAFIEQLMAQVKLGESPHYVLLVALDNIDGLGSDGLNHLSMKLDKKGDIEVSRKKRLTRLSFHIAARGIQLLEDIAIIAVAPDQFKAPVRLFISYARADLDEDRNDPPHQTMAALNDLPVEPWVDAGKITPGQGFEMAIKAGIRDCTIVLAFYTNRYGSRPWCQYEVLKAKSLGAHLLVVDALQGEEPRIFPYLGNVPSIRWQYGEADTHWMAEQVVERAIREALRLKYNRALMKQYAGSAKVLITAPEALTLADPSITEEEQIFLYPDPPLGQDELEVLTHLRPKARFFTPITRFAAHYRLTPSKVIGVSISNSHDPKRYGFSLEHQKTLSEEIHLYLLAAGLCIAYGGALKGFDEKFNFTRLLFDLVRSHSPKYEGTLGAIPLAPIQNFPPWPLILDYEIKDWSLFKDNVAQYVETKRPPLPWSDDDLFPKGGTGWRLNPKEPRQRYAWARGLTSMREQMTQQTFARVVIGGDLIKFQGLVSGVVEEAWFSLRNPHPLFLIGAFGGAARAVSDLLTGIHRPEFTEEFQRQNVPDYDASVALYAQHGGQFVTMPQMADDFRRCGQDGLANALNNGLNDQENLELIHCADPPRIALLILMGLNRLS